MNKEIYNSVLKKEIRDFIALKRTLGFSYHSEAASLRRIDTFLNEHPEYQSQIQRTESNMPHCEQERG